MPRISKEIREQIKSLSTSDLQQIVLKMASKEKVVYDFIRINFLDKENGEQDLFETAKADISILFYKQYKGRTESIREAKVLTACIKRTNAFTKTSKNKELEADLLLYILENTFSFSPEYFGTFFTGFDFKVGQILKRLITIVTKKLHPDYLINYQSAINKYLTSLHKTSNHIDFIYGLPKSI